MLVAAGASYPFGALCPHALSDAGDARPVLAGVDEAGRGPVLGPLVVAAVLIETDAPLRALGVKDSKLLSPAKREEMAPKIRELCSAVETLVIPPEELNRRMPRENLNKIEVKAFAELLRRLRPAEAVLDACDVKADRFGHEVGARVGFPVVIRAEHEADKNHPVVAAASVIAKVERDRHIHELRERYGELGSGYSHDAITRRFLEEWVATRGKLPPFARLEWKTARRLDKRDRTLFDFG